MVLDIIENGPGALVSYYDWLATAKPGQRVRYYLGNLASDRDQDHPRGQTADGRREIDALNALANRVLADARQGKLNLFQRKVGDDVYEYLADRRADRAISAANENRAADAAVLDAA